LSLLRLIWMLLEKIIYKPPKIKHIILVKCYTILNDLQKVNNFIYLYILKFNYNLKKF